MPALLLECFVRELFTMALFGPFGFTLHHPASYPVVHLRSPTFWSRSYHRSSTLTTPRQAVSNDSAIRTYSSGSQPRLPKCATNHRVLAPLGRSPHIEQIQRASAAGRKWQSPGHILRQVVSQQHGPDAVSWVEYWEKLEPAFARSEIPRRSTTKATPSTNAAEADRGLSRAMDRTAAMTYTGHDLCGKGFAGHH